VRFSTSDQTEFYAMINFAVTTGLTFEATTHSDMDKESYEIVFTGGF